MAHTTPLFTSKAPLERAGLFFDTGAESPLPASLRSLSGSSSLLLIEAKMRHRLPQDHNLSHLLISGSACNLRCSGASVAPRYHGLVSVVDVPDKDQLVRTMAA